MSQQVDSHQKAQMIVTGRVQGVFFRAWTQETALQLGLTGWVRNLPNGSVKIMAEGDLTSLKTFIQRCHKGPAAAEVLTVEVSWHPSARDLTTFEIRYE